MEKAKETMKTARMELILTAVIAIVIGVLFVARPATSGKIICCLVGIVLCVVGVVRIILYFAKPAEQGFGSFGLVRGAALLLIGAYVLINPEFLSAVLTALFAIYLIVDGVLKLQYAIDLKRMQAGGWWTVLLMGVAMAILGVVVLMNPFATMVTLVTFLGVVLIADGVLDIIAIAYVSSVMKKVGKAVDDAVAAATAIETEGEIIDDGK